MYLCSAFGDALRVKAAAQHSSSELGSAFALRFTCHRQQTKQERSYEIQIGNSSIEGILRQQRPGFSEGRGENETTDG
jgi:hypothetical protein